MSVRQTNILTGEETVREYTPEELQAIANAPQPLAPTPQQQIENLERSVSTTLQRGFREVLLTLMEREAAAMGITPAQLYATNVGYRRAKDIDNQIAALREQMS
jgi:hypothetical protein